MGRKETEEAIADCRAGRVTRVGSVAERLADLNAVESDRQADIAHAIELARRVDAGLEPLTPFDPAEYLDSPEAVALFLADAEAMADPAYIEHARQVAARASAMHGLE